MNRKLSREKAMEILFTMELNKETVDDAINNYLEDYDSTSKGLDLIYIRRVLSGINENQLQIEKQINEKLKNWTLDRIAKINLVILKIATYEILFEEDIPKAVSINEAVELTKKYSDLKSVSFVNGVLDKINK
ncbi:transcription antitermination factor NusB [Clostridium sp. BJN0001]|uniref:transcription antitermination factor NusB n=1 Tax=Clostridium sp. BJN0001 TaxID=2930219 RepID=UPI001FD2CBE1|nr:transcription antitermination factor NusB [Clostridium sp. BJN0001]